MSDVAPSAITYRVADHSRTKVVVLETIHRKPVLRQMRLAAIDFAAVEGDLAEVVEAVNLATGVHEPILDDEPIRAGHELRCCLFGELTTKSTLERIANLIFAADERVERIGLVGRALDQQLPIDDDDRADARANEVARRNGSEEFILVRHHLS